MTPQNEIRGLSQDEIIDIYKEVSNKLCNGTEWCWAGVGEPLQWFVKLVAAAEASKERGACAVIADSMDACQDGEIGKAIRARGEPTSRGEAQ